jgi:hypothetical protein
MKKLIRRLFGIDKLEAEKTQAQEALALAQAETTKAQELEAQAKMTPKDRATARGEAWVAVLDTKVNPDNVRNGFFELDWNELFIAELKKSGYGFDGDPEEEIVDRWFRDLAGNMLAEAGQDPGRHTAGFINVTKLADNKAQVE